MPAGRPLLFKNKEELQEKIDEFFLPFETWEEDTKRCTITRLAVHLDTSRKTLVEYEWKDEFSNTVKKAKDKVEQYYEDRLIDRGNWGDIFAMKNLGWTDRTEVDNTNKNLNVEIDKDSDDYEAMVAKIKQLTE